MLIADSGATKSDWRFIGNDKKIISFSSPGFNPLFWKSIDIATELKKQTPKIVLSEAENPRLKIFFYGASCSSKERNKVIEIALRIIFQKAKIEINHDLLASARALCGKTEGIAGILGTGSNSCYYDGKKITETKGGLTFILGDEGSGAHMGNELLRAFLNNEMPDNIRTAFLKKYKINKDKIYEALYKKPHPNRYLASFADFVDNNQNEPYLRELAKECFRKFFDKTVCKYKNYKNIPFHCVGSVGFHFSEIVKEVAKEKNILVGNILKSPIEGLVEYHRA